MEEFEECPECEGKGWYWVITDINYDGVVYEEQELCGLCNGSGYILALQDEEEIDPMAEDDDIPF